MFLKLLPIQFIRDIEYRLPGQFIHRVAQLRGAKRVDFHDCAGGINHKVHGWVVLKNVPPLLLAGAKGLFGLLTLHRDTRTLGDLLYEIMLLRRGATWLAVIYREGPE